MTNSMAMITIKKEKSSRNCCICWRSLYVYGNEIIIKCYGHFFNLRISLTVLELMFINWRKRGRKEESGRRFTSHACCVCLTVEQDNSILPIQSTHFLPHFVYAPCSASFALFISPTRPLLLSNSLFAIYLFA